MRQIVYILFLYYIILINVIHYPNETKYDIFM